MQSLIDAGTAIPTKVAPRTTPVGRCPACGESGGRFLFKTIDRLHGVPGEYTYRRCRACRSVFQDPRVTPDDLALCYPSQYYTHFLQDEAQKRDSGLDCLAPLLSGLRNRIRRAIIPAVQGSPLPGPTGYLGRVLAHSRRLRERAFYYVSDQLIPRAPGLVRALDVGCGGGQLMAALRLAGWDVEAVEWDPVAARTARELTGCPVWQGDFRSLDLPLEAYDLVVLNHVFEHLDEPFGALQRIRQLLRPNGRAVLVYPNPDSIGAKIFGSSWFPWEAPRHLALLTSDGLREVAKRAGLSVNQIRTSGSGAASWFAHSRAYRAGRSLNEFPCRVSYLDRIAARSEGILTRMGFKIGEEVTVVLAKGSQPKESP